MVDGGRKFLIDWLHRMGDDLTLRDEDHEVLAFPQRLCHQVEVSAQLNRSSCGVVGR